MAKFRALFACEHIVVPGRTYPVAVEYAPAPVPDYVDGAVDKAIAIHTTAPRGDILIFLTGQADIMEAANSLTYRASELKSGLTDPFALLCRCTPSPPPPPPPRGTHHSQRG